MSKNKKVTLACTYCKHTWQDSIENLLRKEIVIIHRGAEEPEQRRVRCPNCEKDNIFEIPAAWRDCTE